MTTAVRAAPEVQNLYNRLEEKILERSQTGTSEVFYDLIRAGRPLEEMLLETVRVHAPYTHVPFHQRIDNGVVRFVNNDHCLLSARASLRLHEMLGEDYQFLPMAQTMWYVPIGLDPWNQLLGKMPGHYSRVRRDFDPDNPHPVPEVHWPDADPIYLDGTLDEQLDQWLTLVQRGEVVRAYSVMRGLIESAKSHDERERVLAQLVFAGLIDVQDRMYMNRSYTTGHRAYRARATVELGTAVGWENAHPIVYAGTIDLAVGPRWYSSYEMAGEVAWIQLAEPDERQKSSVWPTPELPPERRLLANEMPLTPAESDMLLYALTKAPEPAYIEAISALLLAGKDPRAIVDVMQVAASKLVLETADPRNFSMPQHCYEYTNTLGWFYDRFDHPHRLKLLYVGGSFLAQCANWLRNTPGNTESNTTPPKDSETLSRNQLLQNLDDAMVRRSPIEAVAWVRAYMAGGYNTKPLVRTLALGAAKQGNDTHNQELGLCFLEDYLKSGSHHAEMLLRGCAQHTAGHMKYGDSLEPYRRFSEAFGIHANQSTQGDADPSEAVLDD
jgi:hypothetical protein